MVCLRWIFILPVSVIIKYYANFIINESLSLSLFLPPTHTHTSQITLSYSPDNVSHFSAVDVHAHTMEGAYIGDLSIIVRRKT